MANTKDNIERSTKGDFQDRKVVIEMLSLMSNARDFEYNATLELKDYNDHEGVSGGERVDEVIEKTLLCKVPKIGTNSSSKATIVDFEGYTARDSMSIEIDDGHSRKPSRERGNVVLAETDFPPPRLIFLDNPPPKPSNIEAFTLTRKEELIYELSIRFKGDKKYALKRVKHSDNEVEGEVILAVVSDNNESIDIDFSESEWNRVDGIAILMGELDPSSPNTTSVNRKQGVVLIK